MQLERDKSIEIQCTWRALAYTVYSAGLGLQGLQEYAYRYVRSRTRSMYMVIWLIWKLISSETTMFSLV